MPRMNKRSEWRENIIRHYYKEFLAELPKIVRPKEKFWVKNIWHKLECIRHLSDSYAYDLAIAMCTQAELDGFLLRTGRFFSLKEKEIKNVSSSSAAHV